MTSLGEFKKKPRLSDHIVKVLIGVSTIITVGILVGIIAYIFVRGLPGISWQLISTAPSELRHTVGILPIIINTLYIVVLTLLFTVPIGISAAIYLTEYAKKGRFIRIVEFTTEVLSGIPSIIFGLFGFAFFCVFLNLQYSILAGTLTLTILTLPTIIRTTQEALKSVPASYREGALALGATKFYLIFTILLPSAKRGILVSVILTIGRIVGESAALILTAGIGYAMPEGFFSHIGQSGATLTVQLYQYAMRGEDLQISFAIAAILMILVLCINLVANRIGSIGKEKEAR